MMLLCMHAGAFGRSQTEPPPGFDLKMQVDPSKATVGDPIRIDFYFALPPGFRLIFPNIESRIGEFMVLEKSPGPEISGTPAPAAPRDGMQRHRARIVVAAYRTGEFEFPQLAFVLRDPNGNETPVPSPAVKIRIDSVLQGDLDLKDLKKQAEIPEPSPWLLWTLLALAGLALGCAAWLLKKRRRPRIPSAVPVPEVDFLDLAEAEFRDLLKRGLLEKGMIKQFYVKMSDIIKNALEASWRVPTMEQTTSEIMEAFSGIAVRLEPGILDQIESFLLSCDMVKFARYVPSARETDDCIHKAERILGGCRARRMSVASRPASVAEGS